MYTEKFEWDYLQFLFCNADKNNNFCNVNLLWTLDNKKIEKSEDINNTRYFSDMHIIFINYLTLKKKEIYYIIFFFFIFITNRSYSNFAVPHSALDLCYIL